jgi:hypothetical protein
LAGVCVRRVAELPLFRGNQPERVRVMAKTELKTDAANVALRAAAIIGVMYGFGFLLMPYAMFQLSGDPGVPANPGWVRWAGGFVLGIAIGPWLASEGWVKEQPFIAGVAAAFTLSGLALLYSVGSGEYAGAAWFIWMPIVLLAVLAPAMWWLVAK